MFGRHREAVGTVVRHRMQRRTVGCRLRRQQRPGQLGAHVLGMAIHGHSGERPTLALQQFRNPGALALQAAGIGQVAEMGGDPELIADGQGRRTFQIGAQPQPGDGAIVSPGVPRGLAMGLGGLGCCGF